MRRGPYVTKGRLESVRASLSDRQRDVMADVDAIGVMSGRQLKGVHYDGDGLSARLARRELAEMVDHGVLRRLDRQVGGRHAGSDGYCYVLSELIGERLLHPGKRRYWQRSEPGSQFVSHGLALAQLYTDLRILERTDAAEVAEILGEPLCWRRYFGPGGSPRWLKPDAYLSIASGEFEDHYFIEIDCDSERPRRIETKARAYVSYYQSGREQAESDVFPLVVFVVPSEDRKKEVVSAVTRLSAEWWRLFVVVTAGTAASLLIGGSLAAGASETAS